MKKVVCFGEILWDLFPGDRKPGGAPMNVAFHLKKLGVEPQLITAVGKDQNGASLLDHLSKNGISSGSVQQSVLPTGTVDVQLDQEGKASYRINSPVAWDTIQYDPRWEEAVKGADALVFGTLACRNEVSRKTLLRLLKSASLRILDMNLRPPHFETEILNELLHQTDMLKINDEELLYLKTSFNQPGADLKTLEYIGREFSIRSICVTMGAKGALLWTADRVTYHPGYRITVKDTVGSGDAFLAAFIHGLLNGYPHEQILRRANATGAVVAGKSGATPDYSEKEMQTLLSGYF
jgi:fructokinase